MRCGQFICADELRWHAGGPARFDIDADKIAQSSEKCCAGGCLDELKAPTQTQAPVIASDPCGAEDLIAQMGGGQIVKLMVAYHHAPVEACIGPEIKPQGPGMFPGCLGHPAQIDNIVCMLKIIDVLAFDRHGKDEGRGVIPDDIGHGLFSQQAGRAYHLS